MGRNEEDITSSYIKYIRYMRDARKFLFWVDNCSAPNKKCTLFTTLCYAVNSPDFKCETITLNYFEVGQTYMAVDSFHKEIEDEMKKMYMILKTSRRLSIQGELLWKWMCLTSSNLKASKAKGTCYPKLENVVVVQFRKGSSKMFWKDNLMDTEFKNGEYLQKNVCKSCLKTMVFQQIK